MSTVFLSHSTDDARFVNRLAADLNAAGYTVWKAPESIRPGEEWMDAIQRGLAESDYFLLVISPTAVASRWVKHEVNAAIRFEADDHLVIIPLLYKPAADVPPFWLNFQAIEISKKTDQPPSRNC